MPKKAPLVSGRGSAGPSRAGTDGMPRPSSAPYPAAQLAPVAAFLGSALQDFYARNPGRFLCQEPWAVIANECQVAAQNIYHLWQCIDTGPAKKLMDSRYPSAAVRRGSELKRLNPSAAAANPNSAAQHRAVTISLNGECDRRYQRQN